MENKQMTLNRCIMWVTNLGEENWMSKNNSQEIMRKMAKQHQRFGLRKLSVGVASVLLGTTFIFGSGLVAHADETTAVVDNTAETQQTSTSVASSSDQDGASAASSQSSSTANVAQSEATPAVNVQNNKKTNNAAVNDGAKNVTTPSSAAINSKVKEDQLTGNKQQAAPVVLSEEPTESSAPASDKQTPQVKIPFKVQYELQDGTYRTTTKEFTFNLNPNGDSDWMVPDDVDTKFGEFKNNIIKKYYRQGYTYDDPGADSLDIGWPHNIMSADDLQTIKNNHGELPTDWCSPDGNLSIKFYGRTVTIVTPNDKKSYYQDDNGYAAADVKKGDLVPGTSAHFLKDIPVSDVGFDCTRSIVFHYWDGHTETKKQTISVGRLSEVDDNLITGELTGLDGEWPDFEQWDEYDLPENTYFMHPSDNVYSNPVDGEYSLNARSFDPNKPDERNVTVDVYVGQPAHYTFKYVNMLTGETLTPWVNNGEGDQNAYLDPSWSGQKLADYIGNGDLDSDGQASTNDRPAYAINGYKLLNYDQIAQQKIDGQDQTITFEYAPLSPVVTKYVDEKSGKVIYQGYIDNVKNKALPG